MDGRRASVKLVRPFQKAEGEVSGSIRAENKDSLSLSLSGFLLLLCCPFALFSCELRFGLFLQPLARLALKKALEDQL